MFILFEYLDDYNKLIETSLFETEDFYSHLNMENDADYAHAKRVYTDFEIKKIRRMS